jgi:hypothetical protein
MDIWEKEYELDGKIFKIISIKKLISRLKIISKQENTEVMKLALQSIIDELQEK